MAMPIQPHWRGQLSGTYWLAPCRRVRICQVRRRSNRVVQTKLRNAQTDSNATCCYRSIHEVSNSESASVAAPCSAAAAGEDSELCRNISSFSESKTPRPRCASFHVMARPSAIRQWTTGIRLTEFSYESDARLDVRVQLEIGISMRGRGGRPQDEYCCRGKHRKDCRC
jgi:hypothetical protein